MTQNNMEVVAYAEVIDGKVVSVRLDKSRHCTEPLVTLTSAQAEIAVQKQANEALMRERANITVTHREQLERLTKERDEWRKRYHETHELLIACDEERISWQQSYEGSANRAEAAEKERDALREALVLAEEVARDITASPAGSLWNYGTKPSRLDEAKWQGSREAAEAILAALQPLGPKND
jgi:hypothetical protein